MDAEFWHERWRSDRIGFHQGRVNPYLIEHWAGVRPDPAEVVFVPLCGKAHDLGWLRERGHQVVGVELSEIACRDFFAERSLKPDVSSSGAFTRFSANGISLWCGDFFGLQPQDLPAFSLIYDRAALIALPPTGRHNYATHLQRLAPTGSRMLLITLDYPPQASFQGPPFAVGDAEVNAHYRSRFQIEQLAHQPLAADDGLHKRGLRDATESVYLLTPRHPT